MRIGGEKQNYTPTNIEQLPVFRKGKSETSRHFVNYDKILCKQYYVNLSFCSILPVRSFPFLQNILCMPDMQPLHIGQGLITICNQPSRPTGSTVLHIFLIFGYFHILTCFAYLRFFRRVPVLPRFPLGRL